MRNLIDQMWYFVGQRNEPKAIKAMREAAYTKLLQYDLPRDFWSRLSFAPVRCTDLEEGLYEYDIANHQDFTVAPLGGWLASASLPSKAQDFFSQGQSYLSLAYQSLWSDGLGIDVNQSHSSSSSVVLPASYSTVALPLHRLAVQVAAGCEVNMIDACTITKRPASGWSGRCLDICLNKGAKLTLISYQSSIADIYSRQIRRFFLAPEAELYWCDAVTGEAISLADAYYHLEPGAQATRHNILAPRSGGWQPLEPVVHQGLTQKITVFSSQILPEQRAALNAWDEKTFFEVMAHKLQSNRPELIMPEAYLRRHGLETYLSQELTLQHALSYYLNDYPPEFQVEFMLSALKLLG